MALPVGWPWRPPALRSGWRLGPRSTVLAMAAALTVAVIVLRRLGGAGRPRAGGSCRRCWRRLLVPAQPGRRRQPDARGRAAWGRSRCPIPSGCRTAGPTSPSPTTRPTPASGASTSLPACTRPSAALWPLVVAGAIAAALAGPGLGPRPRRALGRRRRPLRHARLPLHPAQRRRRRGRPGRLRDQHPLRDPGPARRPGAAAAARASSTTGAGAVGAARRPASLVLVAHRPLRRRPARPLPPLRAAARGPRWCWSRPALLRARVAAPRRGASPAASPLWPSPSRDRLPAAARLPRRSLPQRRSPRRAIPGMDLDSAYRWARGVDDARIGLAGTTAGFLGYGFYGTDLSNRVVYLGEEGPHGAFNAIPTCAALPRRRQRRRPRLPGHLAVPQLHRHRPAGALAGGRLAARRARGRADRSAAAR